MRVRTANTTSQGAGDPGPEDPELSLFLPPSHPPSPATQGARFQPHAVFLPMVWWGVPKVGPQGKDHTERRT